MLKRVVSTLLKFLLTKLMKFIVVSLLVGTLPFKYLGVPSASRKLNFSRCKCKCKILVDKITARAQTWMAKSLSYGGRLQLIKSILSSMQNY